MKKLFIISAFVLSQGILAQEVTYFDQEWKVVKDKKNASYYRETTKKGDLYHIKDFYINGTLQMEGMATNTKPNAEVFQGKVVWYYPDGKVNILSNYDSKGIQIGEHKYYNEKGQVINDFIYKDGEVHKGKYYVYQDEYSPTNIITEYANGDIAKTVVYDKSPRGIRYEEVYDKGFHLREAKYYGEGGKFLGSYKEEKGSYTGTGTKVDYYYNPMQVSCVTTYKKGVTAYHDTKCYYGNKKLKKEIINRGKTAIENVYNEKGKKIGTMEYRYSKEYESLMPYTGTMITLDMTHKNKKIQKIDQYKNGVLIESKYNDEKGNLEQHTIYAANGETKEIISYEDGKKIAQLSYRGGLPYDGLLINKNYEYQYQKGQLKLEKLKDSEGNLYLEKKLNESKNQYETKVFSNNKPKYFYTMQINDRNEQGVSKFTGEIIPYDEKGKPQSKIIIKNGVVEKGKLKLTTYEGTVEYSKKGKWLVKKTYNNEKELIKEEKYKYEKVESDYYLYEIYEEMLRDNYDAYPEPIPVEADYR